MAPSIAASRSRATPRWCSPASSYSAGSVLDDRARKTWFLTPPKYGQPDWTFSPGYPLLDRIILYQQQIEI